MTTLNLENRNVFQAELTVDEARQMIDGAQMSDELATKFDEAQGFVFSNEGNISYLVIMIKK